MVSPEDLPSIVRTLIVDDEPPARTNLRLLLQRHADVQIVGEAGSGSEALKEIRGKRPKLIFLDVQMPEYDGFDVIEMLGGDVPPAVIFVTAYDRYAIKAFDAGALDYLLKPFDDARFELALRRAQDKIGRRGPASGRGLLMIKSAGQVLFLEPNEIDWIEAANYYSCLHVGSKTHLLRRSMSELDRDLDPNIFQRVHRSTIVNLARVRAMQVNRNGEHEVLLRDGSTLPVSRRYRRQLHFAMATTAGDTKGPSGGR